ncbi:hypothetical protein BC332_16070 [Capsicum chinense]|nr:hypothetical protein BC332_16070 [Capsicum chinense]
MLLLNQFKIQFFRHHSFHNRYITYVKSLKVPRFKQVSCKPILDGFKGQNPCVKHKSLAFSLNVDEVSVYESYNVEENIDVIQEKSFWGALGMTVDTAVGPGMLGLPTTTIKSGPLPSAISLLLTWRFSSVLPAIPVVVLKMGFHVITPFICKFAGNTIHDARKAIIIGGTIPLVMVVSWNLIVLGLSGHNASLVSNDPISLLLSVNSSAIPTVQCVSFSTLFQ